MILSLPAGLLCVAAAIAGPSPRIYVNGERADGLRDVVLDDVDIRIDEKGHIWITAPLYAVGGTAGAEAVEKPPAGVWWLLVEDLDSSNLAVSVIVNGHAVTTLKSGVGAGRLDLQPWLHRGANQVVMNAQASPSAGGGPIVVSIGSLQADGTMPSPAVRFARDPAAAAEALERTFVLRIP
jgi:hypothetical protein